MQILRTIPPENRICEICFQEVEDETHFLLKCPLYNIERTELLDSLAENNQNSQTDFPTLFKRILTSDNKSEIKKLAQFLEAIFAKRSKNLFRL